MKRLITTVLVFQMMFASICNAEQLDNWVYLSPEKYIRPSYLTCATMTSEEEYWYSGTTERQEPWVIMSDSTGKIICQEILNVERKYQMIKGINKSEKGVIVGLVDARTLDGIIRHKDREGKTKYTEIGNSNVYKYAPTDNGGLIAQCVWYNEDSTLCAPRIISIDGDGSVIYDIIGKKVVNAIDKGALTRSLIYEENGIVYVLEVQGVAEAQYTREELVCYDETGKEAWRTKIPEGENLEINDITAYGENIYLVGYIGEWETEYVLGNRKGIIICYSTDGTYKWGNIVSEFQGFRYGDAGKGVCVAGEMVDDKWVVLVMSNTGEGVFVEEIDADNCYMRKINIVEDKRIVILGSTDEKLIMKKLEYK